MASVSMALSITSATCQKKTLQPTNYNAFLKPLPVRPSKVMSFNSKSKTNVKVEASLKEKAITGLTAAAVVATMVIPDVAQAAGSDLTPSLQNFLFSIISGGVVLTGILGAVIGVSNFDPVNRT